MKIHAVSLHTSPGHNPDSFVYDGDRQCATDTELYSWKTEFFLSTFVLRTPVGL
jgi:hypothetical protein